MTRTLDELDNAVQALEGSQNDQINPGVFSLNSQGQIEEALSGHLTATGIDLTAATGLNPAIRNLIRWLQNDQDRADIFARVASGVSAEESQLFLRVLNTLGNEVAELVLLEDSIGGSINGHGFNLMTKDAASSWLQLHEPAKRQVTLKQATLTWPGGQQSNDLEVTGFPGTSVGFYFIQPAVNNLLVATTIDNASPTAVKFRGWSITAATEAGQQCLCYVLGITD
jgi:hypothetical protein